MPAKSKKHRVAIQGEPGSFSEEAARRLLGRRVQVVSCPTFREAFARLRSGAVDRLVVPVENTLAGSVHENYDLLVEHGFWAEAELDLRIRHTLIAPRGVRLADVRDVHSHPVALAQCHNFFARHRRLQAVADYDTAGSVKRIVADGRRDAAAIAGPFAAAVYGARILARNLEDDPGNFTRFLMIRRRAVPRPAPACDKTSIVFATRNIPGALFRCLAAFALRDVNLTKLESRPWRGRPFEYLFYLDFLGRPDRSPVREALAHLREHTNSVRILGCYPRHK
jgi:prephenate dehydratase